MNHRTSLALSLVPAVLLATSIARADGLKVAGEPSPAPDVTAEVGIYGYGSSISIDNSLHAVGGDTPDVLKHRHFRMTGIGAMPGGELRFAAMPRLDPYGRLRFGLDIGVGGLTGLGTSSRALPDGISYKPSQAWGAHVDGFIGREFAIGRRADILAPGRRAWLYPYVDVRVGATITQAKIDLHTEKFGFVGSTTFDAYSFELGPRAGVAIPLGGNVSFDLGGYGAIYGVERWGGYAGFSIVTP